MVEPLKLWLAHPSVVLTRLCPTCTAEHSTHKMGVSDALRQGLGGEVSEEGTNTDVAVFGEPWMVCDRQDWTWHFLSLELLPFQSLRLLLAPQPAGMCSVSHSLPRTPTPSALPLSCWMKSGCAQLTSSPLKSLIGHRSVSKAFLAWHPRSHPCMQPRDPEEVSQTCH